MPVCRWIYDAFEHSDEIMLHSLGVHVSLADAYTDVEFEEPAAEVQEQTVEKQWLVASACHAGLLGDNQTPVGHPYN